MTVYLIPKGMKEPESGIQTNTAFLSLLLLLWWDESWKAETSAWFWSSLASAVLLVQRFFLTHRRNTSDYSSDSSSTGNSPETQHNVSFSPPLWGNSSSSQLAACLNTTLSLLRLLGTHPGESPIIWPPGGCAITWVVRLSVHLCLIHRLHRRSMTGRVFFRIALAADDLSVSIKWWCLTFHSRSVNLHVKS